MNALEAYKEKNGHTQPKKKIRKFYKIVYSVVVNGVTSQGVFKTYADSRIDALKELITNKGYKLSHLTLTINEL